MAGVRQESDEILVSHVYKKACVSSKYYTFCFILLRHTVAIAILRD